MVKSRPVCICDVCGHEWLSKSDGLPKRCASKRKCLRWNSGQKAKTGRGNQKASPAKDEQTRCAVIDPADAGEDQAGKGEPVTKAIPEPDNAKGYEVVIKPRVFRCSHPKYLGRKDGKCLGCGARL